MTYAEVKELLNAGFSHDEIMNLCNPPADNPPADNPPADNPQADNPPADNPPADNPLANDTLSELRNLFSSLKESNSQLIRTIQASNLKNASLPSMGDIDSKVDSIMASLIRTPTEGKEN